MATIRGNKIKRRIRTNLIISYVTPVVVLEIAFAFLFFMLAKDSLEKEMGRRLVAIAQSAAAQIPVERCLTLKPGDETTRNYQNLQVKLANLASLNEVKKIYVFNKESLSLVDSTGEIAIGTRYYRLVSDRLELAQAQEGHATSSTLFMGPDEQYYKSGYAPLWYDGKVEAMIGVDASADFFITLMEIRRNMVYLTATTVLGLVIISLFFARRIERPIRELVRSARRIGDGDLEQSITSRSRDEIGFLAHTMEEMRTSIIDNTNHLHMLQRGIAHEVRNPLGGIGLFADLLMDEVPEESQKEYIRKIQKELGSLDRVVNAFLDYTRQLVPELTMVNVKTFLQEAVELCSGEIFEKNIALTIDVDDSVGEVPMDRDLMQSVLINVCHNACQSMQQDGTLQVAARKAGEFFEIQVTDSGKGIDEETRQQVFKPFFTTKERGSGLGLAFAKKICEHHKGSIEMQSEVNAGTTITIRLPLNVEG